VSEESTYDRAQREQRERDQAETPPAREQEEFLGQCLEPVAEKVRAEVTDGLRKILGAPLPGNISGLGTKQEFYLEADSPKEGGRGRAWVRPSGTGPEFKNAEARSLPCRSKVPVSKGYWVAVRLDAADFRDAEYVRRRSARRLES
jgi:hypothetical protein